LTDWASLPTSYSTGYSGRTDLADRGVPALPLPARYGKKYWGVERTTFIVGPDGKVARVLPRVKPGEHDALVLAALEELSPPVI